jgi:hypothetical protein
MDFFTFAKENAYLEYQRKDVLLVAADRAGKPKRILRFVRADDRIGCAICHEPISGPDYLCPVCALEARR